MSYYTDLMKKDVLHWMMPLVEKGAFKVRRSDGKFESALMQEAVGSPWHHINYSVGGDCPWLHQYLFNVVSPRTPIGRFIPEHCQSCWKIVIRPHNLKQLFALESLLIDMDLPSKCGIERRAYTPLSKHLYGGYIYSSSVEQGLERLDLIRSKLAESSELKDVECYLKRACTEMELAFPDSTKWKVTKEQREIEKLLNWLVVYDIEASMTAKHIIDKIHMTWIEWAAQHGDETYLEYTDGERLYEDCVKYERAVEGADEATPDDETVSVGDSSTAVPKENTRTEKKGKKK